MPAGPSTSTSQGCPPRARASPSSSASNSRCRPTKTEEAGGVSSCLCVAMLSWRNLPRLLLGEARSEWGFPCSEAATGALASARMEGELWERFAEPSPAYSPAPLWWWSGDSVTAQRLRWQLERLAAGGGFQRFLIQQAASRPGSANGRQAPPFL